MFDSDRFKRKQPPRPHPQPHPQHQHQPEGDRVLIADTNAEKTPQIHSFPQPHPERTPNDNTNAETPAIDDSEDENQPPPPQFKIPKTEEVEEAQPAEEAQPQPSQTVVEVVNVLPTQEVIDISSSPEEDQQQHIVPKEEQDVENSPCSRIISSVLVSIRLEPPSFDLGVEPPLLTPQTMDAIDDIDDKLKKNPKLLRTPDPLGTFDILADMEKKGCYLEHNPKGG
ncbi:hypothetical protein PIB30_010484 [Stylosanthes scabra]|uniref:Uncharacterized protein n=1 Tax=Stylosanthes scabra TaxID=79078 RepID=A0ABU6Z287_9FABA|nr:hypothetical protein [Stylosanthes scabra]